MQGFSGTYELKPTKWIGGWRGKQLYEFANDANNPLTYEDAQGNLIRPDQHQTTDLGSVPKIMQWICPKYFAKDRYIPGYVYHDDAYQNHGWWYAKKGGWNFRKVTRKQADIYLRQMVMDLGGSKGNAWAIYMGVRIGGGKSWTHKHSPKAK